jgi:hypothetical protein
VRSATEERTESAEGPALHGGAPDAGRAGRQTGSTSEHRGRAFRNTGGRWPGRLTLAMRAWAVMGSVQPVPIGETGGNMARRDGRRRSSVSSPATAPPAPPVQP